MKRLLLKSFVLAMVGMVYTAGAQAEEGMFSTKSLTLKVATKAAQAALDNCRASGFQVAVAVIDRGGNLQVLLRDRYAGPHTVQTAMGKAWTAVSFRSNTSSMVDLIKKGEVPPGIQDIPGALFVGGGMPVQAAGSIVAGIGVSGAPGGSKDDVCAKAGIDAIEADIAF